MLRLYMASDAALILHTNAISGAVNRVIIPRSPPGRMYGRSAVTDPALLLLESSDVKMLSLG